jgi:opacity protein-like surface antigen
MRKVLMLVTMVWVLLAPLMASAADRWYVGALLGSEFFTSDAGDFFDDGIAYGVFGGYRLERQISLEASLTTASHEYNIYHHGKDDIQVTSLVFGPRFSGMVGRNMELYAGAGLGLYHIDDDPRDETDTQSGLYLGGGIDFPLPQAMRLGMDFKYHVLFDNSPLDGDIVTLLVRLGFDL